jgi:hypothetical protein
MKNRKVNSALMQTNVCMLLRPLSEAMFKIAQFFCVYCLTNRKKDAVLGDLSLFFEGIFTKQRPLRSRGGGVSFWMPAL